LLSASVNTPLELEIRIATENDRDAIEQLIFLSARELSRGYYTDEQIAAALARVYGVDSALIDDRTYFVAESDGMLVGCGGWSKRKTLFGGDQFANRDSGLLDPRTDAAKIRAFFVHPNYARRGIARSLLARCEAEARTEGFKFLELMSTLPGVEFYRASGFSASDSIIYDAGGVPLDFVPMKKALREAGPR
jgi:GNAT superfamily N-acetyltransferase